MKPGPNVRRAVAFLRRRNPNAFPPGTTLRVGRAEEFPAARNFAYCEVKSPPRIVVAPKLEHEPQATIRAVLAHEGGHAVLLARGNRTHSERKADAAAEVLFNVPISYDERDVQTTGRGTRPRPARLG